jgi:hypothetical protein
MLPLLSANSNLNVYFILCSAQTTADDGNYAKYLPLYFVVVYHLKKSCKLVTSSSQQQAE